MKWQAQAHTGFQRELKQLGLEDDKRIKEGVRRLLLAVASKGDPDSRETFLSGPIVPGVDLQPLRGSRVPGSYRLRVGRFRIALVILPDEKLVILTVVVRRDDTSYRNLPRLHRKRFHDR